MPPPNVGKSAATAMHAADNAAAFRFLMKRLKSVVVIAAASRLRASIVTPATPQHGQPAQAEQRQRRGLRHGNVLDLEQAGLKQFGGRRRARRADAERVEG